MVLAENDALFRSSLTVDKLNWLIGISWSSRRFEVKHGMGPNR